MREETIYFIQAGEDGPIKIGFSDQPRMRVKELQIGCPWRFRHIGAIRGSRAQEKKIHRALAPWRTHGEWFKPDPHVFETIRELISSGESVDLTRRAAKSRVRSFTSRKTEHAVVEVHGPVRPFTHDWEWHV